MHLILHGALFGRENLTNFQFDPNFPYQYCRLCGALFQSSLDRKVPYGHTPGNSRIAYLAQEKRHEWAMTHATENHKPEEHDLLRFSGLYMTAEAAKKLAGYGIVPLSQMLVDEATSMALLEAPRKPEDDACS